MPSRGFEEPTDLPLLWCSARTFSGNMQGSLLSPVTTYKACSREARTRSRSYLTRMASGLSDYHMHSVTAAILAEKTHIEDKLQALFRQSSCNQRLQDFLRLPQAQPAEAGQVNGGVGDDIDVEHCRRCLRPLCLNCGRSMQSSEEHVLAVSIGHNALMLCTEVVSPQASHRLREALCKLTSTGLRPVQGHRGTAGKQDARCSHVLLCRGLGWPAAKDGARAPVHRVPEEPLAVDSWRGRHSLLRHLHELSTCIICLATAALWPAGSLPCNKKEH